MTIVFRVPKTTTRMLKTLERISNKRAIYKEVVKFFDRQGKILAGRVTKNQLSGKPLKRRTGNLARSLAGRGEIIDGLPGMRVGIFRGPALAYAEVQDRGTVGKGGTMPTIVPKKGKALAIPMGPALTKVGVARFGGPREVNVDLKFIPFRNSGVAIGGLYEASSLDGETPLDQARMWYLLVSKVDIKPTHYLSKEAKTFMPPLTERLARFLGELLLAAKQRRRV